MIITIIKIITNNSKTTTNTQAVEARALIIHGLTMLAVRREDSRRKQWIMANMVVVSQTVRNTQETRESNELARED